MDYRFETSDPSRRFKGIIIVVVLHALLGYALVSGLARKGLNLIKKPLEAVVIQEVIIPPPPPPPPPPKKVEKLPDAPKVEAPPPPFVPPPDVAPPVTSNAPVIQSVATPPPAPAVIAPPPPPPAPVATGPKRTSIGLACPTQVAPEMPRKALKDGTEGVVKAQIHIKGGTILDVTILSGPRVFHAAVKEAMMQYTCVTDGGEVIATQEFNFKLE
ncbi:MAG: energy transducer TonB [Polaromonas sp.]|nr:energy transducer TonB [Polaromonas sp.]